MKCTTVIDPSREEEVCIYAHERTPLIDELERLAGAAAATTAVVCTAATGFCWV